MTYELKKLIDVAEIISGGTPQSSNPNYFGGATVWLTPKDLSNHSDIYIENSERTLTAEGIKNSSAKLIPEGSVTLSSRAPIGYVAIPTKPFTTNQGMKSFVPKKDLYNEYLYYYLLYSRSELEKKGSGTTFKEISKSKLEDFQIPIPTLQEQKQIVSKIKECFKYIVKAEDRLIKTEKKAQKLLDSVLKKALMVKRLESYELKDLAELINGDRGKNYPNKSALVKEGVPFITAGHIQDHKVDFSQMNYITEERYNILNNGKIKKDDIIFCLRGSLGKIALIDFNQKGAIASSLVIIRPSSRITSKYLYYYLLSQYGQSQIRLFDNGTAQPNLSAANLNKFIIKLPDNETQKRIVTQIEESAIKISNINKVISKQILNLEKMRQSILKKAFEGKLI